MQFKSFFLLTLLWSIGAHTHAQGVMIYGKHHLIMAEVPKGWLQVQHEELPFVIKPDQKKSDEKTYMYVFGFDYKINPDLNEWIEGNNEHLLKNAKLGVKIDSLSLSFPNFDAKSYTTGRYKTITYTYKDGHKEALLIIECKNSLVTVVMSAVDGKEFKKNLDAFKSIAQSLKILQADVKVEGQEEPKEEAETLTYESFKSLIPALQKEDWKSAFEQSATLLKGAPNDTSEFKAIIIYVNIYAAAGMVTKNEMTYEALKKNIEPFIGQKVIMSSHPISKNPAVTLNRTHIQPKEAHSTAANSKGTNIFCFENFFFAEEVKPADFDGKGVLVRCGGTLNAIETNPNQSTIWVLRLTVKDAFVRKAN
jgi:hypothetical protein